MLLSQDQRLSGKISANMTFSQPPWHTCQRLLVSREVRKTIAAYWITDVPATPPRQLSDSYVDKNRWVDTEWDWVVIFAQFSYHNVCKPFANGFYLDESFSDGRWIKFYVIFFYLVLTRSINNLTSKGTSTFIVHSFLCH